MGVDWYPCAVCNETFPDCGPHGNCEICGSMFCRQCDPGRIHEEDYVDDDGNTDSKALDQARLDACPLCSKQVVTDESLVSFLLDKLGWSRKKAEKEYRKT